MSQQARHSDDPLGQPPLLATKTFVPRAREGIVPRPHLLGRLDDAPNRSLTLLSAPAGFGKTTLITEWLRSRPDEMACWLSLDATDNDPRRFLSYIIAALQRAVPRLLEDLALSLRSSQPPPPEAVVAALINELASVPERISLVLDDYHIITSPPVNASLALLLENQPHNLHLIIVTRSDPMLPVARLRSRGQLTEIRADELRFTPAEAAAFLGQSMGLSLTPAQVLALDERVEGWIAGLQMAALSMRGRNDVDGFIRAFAGTNRFIMDYMLEEVLAREPADVQAFLLQTSILSGLTGSLCDAVTARSGGQEMLEQLERRNLFVVPLDDDRRWYRYHHLFADLLQARLSQSGPEPSAQLRSRAADWCERQGQISEAVGYALAARDYELAAGVIARHWSDAVSTGEVETVWSWLDALPQDVVRNSAPLGVACCWLLWLKGRAGLIEPQLDCAERALSELAAAKGFLADDEMYAPLPALIATLRSIVARYRGEFGSAITHAQRGIELMPDDLPPQLDARVRSVIVLVLAAAYDGAGELESAVEAYDETIGLSRASRSATGLAGATYWLVCVLRLLGRLRRAESVCRDALRFVEEQGMARLPAAGVLHVVMGEVLLERNDLEGAESHLSRGAEIGRWSGRLDAARNAAPALTRLNLARDDCDGAMAAVREAESSLSESSHPLADAELLALRARILVRWGCLPEAARCAGDAMTLAGDNRGSAGEMATLATARVRIAQGAVGEAVRTLTRFLEAAEESGRFGTAIKMRVLRGIAHSRQGDTRRAEEDLERALSLAEPEGYARVFLDEGQPMRELLLNLATRPVHRGADADWSRGYINSLIAAFGAAEETATTGAEITSSGQPAQIVARGGRMDGHTPGLIEPLSDRELQVLRLLADGRTNEQIAVRLIIALGTVKAHIHNISGKLGAQNRAHAVARARELKLLQ